MIRKGFTLIELLIAIAIIGVISAFAYTVINPSHFKNKASDAVIASNLEKLAMGIQSFIEIEGRYPTDAEVSDFAAGRPSPVSTYIRTWPGATYVYGTNGNTFSIYSKKSSGDGYLAYSSSSSSNEIVDCADLTGQNCKIGLGVGSVSIVAVLPSALTINASPPSIDFSESSKLTATLSYTNGSTKDVSDKVSWDLSSGSFVNGVFRPSSLGTVSVSTSYTEDGITVSANASISVTARFDTFVYSPSPFKLQKNQQLSATIYEKNTAGDLTDISTKVSNWVINDPSVVSMPTTGVFKGVAPGDTTISFSYNGHNGSFPVTVLSPSVTSIVITSSIGAMRVYPPETTTLTARANFSDNTSLNVTTSCVWSSSAPSQISVSSAGVLTGYAANTNAVISATYMGVTGSVTVSVPAISSFSVSPASGTYFVGTTKQFIASVVYNDNTLKSASSAAVWTSSQSSYVTVTGGLARFQGAYSNPITITTTYLGRSASATPIYSKKCAISSECSALICVSPSTYKKCDVSSGACYCSSTP